MAYTKTIWVNNSSPYINANNLNKIENQLEENTNDIETNTTNIQTNTENITNITGTILWENSNHTSTSAFASQNITLSSSDYDYLEILYTNWIGQNKYCSVRVPKGKSCFLQNTFVDNSNGYLGVRNINYSTDTSLSVEDCYAIIGGNVFQVQVNNYWNIPQYVIGYKTGLFS